MSTQTTGAQLRSSVLFFSVYFSSAVCYNASLNYARKFRVNAKEKQLKKDKVFLGLARDLAVLSHCAKIKVGALAVRNGRIINSGINGTPEGHTNCDEVHVGEFDHAAHRAWADKHELHAEMNIIAFCAKHGIDIAGTTIYSSLQPCDQCTKNLSASGAVRVVYDKAYDRMSDADRIEAENFMKMSGIILEHVPLDN